MIVDALTTGTAALQVGLAVALPVAVYARLRGTPPALRSVRAALGRHGTTLALAQAALATAGSLYLSNGLGWAPCELCWYQRVAMYPLVPVLAVGVWRGGDEVRPYAAALALVGAPVAAYHYAVQRLPFVAAGECSLTGVSCGVEYAAGLGYVTVPMMALTAFLTVLALVAVAD